LRGGQTRVTLNLATRLDAVLQNLQYKSENGRCLLTNKHPRQLGDKMVSTINEIGNFYPRDSDAPFLVRTSVLHANQVDKMILKVPQELLKHNSLSEIIVE